ncbi:MAG: hypothetical protein F2799_07405 [Actinobacteria bacterium]|uniref:Unannotated protein n=1 Tax=freshwater metagenome TaxID=449393 RepID=A0A6J7EJH7_9ZZZZ|nr:hypothetical protein [Actinomycetota bacterium]
MTITSSDNPAIKELKRLQSSHARSRADVFVAEGEDLIEMAAANGWKPERVLVREGCGLDGEEVEADLLDSVSSLGSGTRAIGIFTKSYVPEVTSGLLVHLAGLSDPGNVGTIIRSAHALGATGVSLGPETADPFGPKAVRASMGSVFGVPLHSGKGLFDLPGIKVALAGGSPSIGAPLPSGNLVLIVGSERTGLDAETLELSDLIWSIPMADGAESLNAAVAVSIALHAANRIPRNA